VVEIEQRRRVIVIGGGFGGLAAARELDGANADVLLIDQHIYSTFQPLLYQVATGGLNPGDISYPIRGFTRTRSVRFRHAVVQRVDFVRRQVHLDDGNDALDYDYLVIATGADVNYFGIPGAAENCVSLYHRRDALAVRDQLLATFESLASGQLSSAAIVLIGGGATGVEMAGTLAELRSAGLAAVYPEIDPDSVQVVLVEQSDTLLAGFEEGLRRYALEELTRRGVDVRLSTTVTSVGRDHVETTQEAAIATNLTVWTAGVGVRDWGLPRGRGGRILVGPDLSVQGVRGVFAVGDVAVALDAPLAQLAQPAIQMGRHAGQQIRRALDGRETEAFSYSDRGTMATIGRRSAVVQLPWLQLRGTIAWLAWLGLHIVSLLGNRNRISALINLSWRYLSWPRGSGVIVGDVPDGP
jgi:NADH dehydrogenase